nr:hypothetical protein Iba_chr14aCG18600 [Ipomoea batatas]GMD89055.1 hypothetical protein Iba_chr14cCG13100 [Ipomoea batatas]GMD93718.1 hypothetical protein Iba_chr14fCG10150 [Ipomoea batatas]
MVRPFQLPTLREVTLITYHEINQTRKVVSQELRSSTNKSSFQFVKFCLLLFYLLHFGIARIQIRCFKAT